MRAAAGRASAPGALALAIALALAAACGGLGAGGEERPPDAAAAPEHAPAEHAPTAVGDAAQAVHTVRTESSAHAQAPAAGDGPPRVTALPPPRASAPGITAELTAEVLALRQGTGLLSLVWVTVLIFVGWLLSIVIHWLIRLAQRLGAPRAPWVDNLGAFARLLVWAWVVAAIVARGWRLAPMLTLLAASVVATGLLVGLLRHFENLSTGIGLALRGRIKVGDQIAVGEHTGMVRAVGLMHLHLRVADGSTVYLPNRVLAREAVAIGRARNSYPLRVRLAGERAWPPAAIETARWVARLSPYRDVNARVSVQTEGAEQSVLVVEIQVWSPRLLEAAEKHLRAMLALHVEGAGADEGARA